MKRLVYAGLAAALFGFGCNDSQLAGVPEVVEPDAPVAVISSPSVTYGTLETAGLDGSQSYDPDNPAPDAIVEYRWDLISSPTGSSSSLVGSGTNVSLFVDAAGPYTVSLVVVDQDALTSLPTEYTIEAVPLDDFHAELSWDIDISDVDLHVTAPGGALFHQQLDCFFGNCIPFGGGGMDWTPPGPAGNPSLDLDDVEGFGPENINIEDPTDGSIYTVSAHYWSDDGLGATTATVRIFLSGELVYEQAQQLSGTGRTWDVVNIAWPSGQITPLGSVYNCDPVVVAFGGTC